MAEKAAENRPKPRHYAARQPKGDRTDELDLAIVQAVERLPIISNTEIGRQLGMDREAVGRRRSRPAWKALWLERNPPATQILEAYRDDAARRYVAMMDVKNTTPAVRERVARVLSGAGQPVKVQVAGEVRLGLDPATRARIRARYLGPDAGAGGDGKRHGDPGRRAGAPRRPR